MTINYGKREANSLTAADPGDTLYIPFASYNDSGDSEALSGLAVSDIEIFKNGGATPRATDSGYSLLTDTGQYGDRVGLYRFEISLFNTSDDTGFFDQGSQYHVAVDAVTIDGKTVRFFPAVFEIGREKVNVKEVDSDTGAADRLGKTAAGFDTGLELFDTGQAVNAVWNALSADHADTGTLGEALGQGVNVTEIRGDTGAASIVASTFADTGFNLRANVEQINGDTGAAAHLAQGYAEQATQSDTGLIANAAAIRAQTDKLQFDTGANELHADIRKVNNIQVSGTGTSGDEWGP